MTFSGLLTRIKEGGKNLQVRCFGKTKTNIRNLTPYGFFCHPPRNSKVVMIPDASKSYYAIAFGNVPNLSENEVEIGNFVIGATIKFDKDGNIEIVSTKDVTVTATNVTVTATQINLKAPTIVNSGSKKVLTDATVIHDSTGNPCTIISGTSNDLKTT